MKKNELKKIINNIENNLKNGSITIDDYNLLKNIYIENGGRKITNLFYEFSLFINRLSDFIETYKIRKFTMLYKSKIYNLENPQLFILMLKYDENISHILKKQIFVEKIIYKIQDISLINEIFVLINLFVFDVNLKKQYYNSIVSTINKLDIDINCLNEELKNLVNNIYLNFKKNNKLQFDYLLINYLISNNIEFVKEYKFTETRNFRFDYYLPKYNIAIEYEGIGNKFNRHTNIVGYSNDLEKYNLSTLYNVRLLRYSQINYMQVIDNLNYLINNK